MEWSFSLKVPVHRGLGLGSRGCWTGWLAVCLLFPWAMLLSAHLSVVTSPWLCACLGSFIHSMMLTFCCCSVTESCPTLCDPMDCSTPGSPVFHCFLEFAQTHGPLSWCCPTISSSVAPFSSSLTLQVAFFLLALLLIC